MVTTLSFSAAIGKRVRSGDWTEQARPDPGHGPGGARGGGDEFGLKAGRREVAAQLVDSFMEEAKVVYVIYKVWTAGFLDWLGGQGVTAAERARRSPASGTLMAYPDGTPLDPVARWDELGRHGRTPGQPHPCVRDHRRGRGRGHGRAVRGVAQAPRPLRGRDGGRPGVRGPALRGGAPGGLLPGGPGAVHPGAVHGVRHARDAVRSRRVERNLYLVLEAMRAHLCGPDRDGSLEYEEHDDRYVVRFDPCGSGGRSMRGDELEGTGSRVLAPYEFGVTQERHDWAWNQEGICYYCAHCCFALEKLPVERWGHPVRVVDPPRWGGAADARAPARSAPGPCTRRSRRSPSRCTSGSATRKPQLPVLGPDGRPA